MRNLKRALSLAMASVMTLGMMTVGTSAKGIADFSDAAEITNVDAVAVTSAIGIFKGYDDGEFKGENVVTRAEMAVICAKLLYGADVDPAQFAGAGKFTDTPAWAEGYINLCASLGIIAGRGNGIFDPSATVSTVEAASMLTKTLGYFKNAKDYGEDWKLAVTAKATNLGLYGDLKLAADAGLTRDSVAELVFNTLTKAVPVDYNELLGVYYNKNQGIVYALEFNYLQTLGYKNFDLVYKTVEEGDIYGRPTTLWGTGHYKHNKDTVTNSSANIWASLDGNGGLISEYVQILDKNEIVKVSDAADYVYTKNTTNETIAKDLGAKILEMDWKYYVNGKEFDIYADVETDGLTKDEIDKAFNAAANAQKPAYVKGNKIVYHAEEGNEKDDDYFRTSKGGVLEIYVDEYANDGYGQVIVCEYNYYLGEVSNVKSDDDGTYVNIKPLSKGGKDLEDKKFYTDELKKGDLVVFTIDENDDEDYYIAELFTPGTVSGEVTRVEDENDSDDTYVRLNGESTKYYYTSEEHNVYEVDGDNKKHPELKEEYILYTTPTDYVLGFELAEETVTKYLYVEDSDEELSDWVAKVVLSDASTAKVDVEKEYKGLDGVKTDIKWDKGYNSSNAKLNSTLDEHIWKYTVSDKGVYTLTDVVDKSEDDVAINNGKSYIEDNNSSYEILIDEDTIFVDTMNDKAYVGYSAVPNVENADIAYVLDKNDIADIVYILEGDIYDKDSTYFVLGKTEHDSLKYDGEWYREYFSAYVNGDKETLMVEYDAWNNSGINDNQLDMGKLYKAVKTIDEEYITEVQVVAPEFEGDLYSVGNNAFKLNKDDNQVKFDTNADTDFVIVEAVYNTKDEVTKYSVTDADISDLKDIKEEVEESEGEYTYTVWVVEEDDNTAELVYVFVNKVVKANETIYTLNSSSNIVPDGVNVLVEKDENGDPLPVATGDTIALELIGGYDAVAKAVNAFEAGKVYTVVINGQACTGYGIEGGKCIVFYVVMSSDITKKELVLNIGTVTLEPKKSVSDETLKGIEKVVGGMDAIEATEKIVDADERLVITLKADKSGDNGYVLSYKTNLDTEYYEFDDVMTNEDNKFVIELTFDKDFADKSWAIKVEEDDEDIVDFDLPEKFEINPKTLTAKIEGTVKFAEEAK